MHFFKDTVIGLISIIAGRVFFIQIDKGKTLLSGL